MDDLLQEFIAETRETLDSLASELVRWEANPGDKQRLDAIFRFFHTIKGSCGFLNLPRFERLSHAAEDVLSALRDGTREPSPALVDGILAIIDRIAELIAVMEAGVPLEDGSDADLIKALSEDQLAVHEVDESHLSDLEITTAADEPATASTIMRSIRVPLDLIDHLMNGVSDMVLARNEVARCLRESDIDPALEAAFHRLSGCIADMRDSIGQTRMQRIERIFSPLPRLVRDLAHELGKKVDLSTSGHNVELDREMLEIIRDPLTHIIRNSVDHGIEPPEDRRAAGKPDAGRLSVSGYQAGNQILIEIVDDGRGIDIDRLVEKAVSARIRTRAEAQMLSDRAKLELIFAPGISTASSVTAISGRGVGMDVVRANIERVGGSIDIDNRPGKGLKIVLRVPLTLTIIPCLTLSAGGQQFAMPRSSIREILFQNNQQVRIEQAGGTRIAYIRGKSLPFVDLEDILGLAADEDAPVKRTIVTINASSDLNYALGVEAVLDHEELVVRPGAPVIMADGLYAGTTLPDNGRPMLLLDPVGMAKRAQISGTGQETVQAETSECAQQGQESGLLFRDRKGRLRAILLGLVERVEDVPADHFAKSCGHFHMRVEDGTRPVHGLNSLPEEDMVKILHLFDGHARLVHAVADVVDIVALPNEFEATPDKIGIAGVMFLGDELVEIVDGHWVFSAMLGDRKTETPSSRPLCCLVGSGDGWARNMLAPLLRSSGYRVVMADSADEAEALDADIYLAMDGEELAGLADLPVVRLGSSGKNGTNGGVDRYDRDGILDALRDGLARRQA
ncbi:MAG: chemotaxis protein CheA [Blastomonas sp.]